MNDCTPIREQGKERKKNRHGKVQLGIVACGALAREIEEIKKINRLQDMEISYLPAGLHNFPERIPGAVRGALEKLKARTGHLFVAYGDCGTAGALDSVIREFGATRLQGAHCYAFFAGIGNFEKMHEQEPGTFYLTDYLARQFDTLVYRPLGLDRHPQLLEEYFGNYSRLLFMTQSNDQKLEEKARDAARRLGLRFEKLQTGFGLLDTSIMEQAGRFPGKRENRKDAKTGETGEMNGLIR